MSVSEFSQNVSAALARVGAGEQIVLTRRGKSIARITRYGVNLTDEERERNIALMKALMERGLDIGGPATYEERTGR